MDASNSTFPGIITFCSNETPNVVVVDTDRAYFFVELSVNPTVTDPPTPPNASDGVYDTVASKLRSVVLDRDTVVV